MKILTVDIGTGTQDIFLYDSALDIENGYKLILPSPTLMVHQRLKHFLATRTPVLLSGYLMGGGPSAWAIESLARAGIPVYMTPEAAQTINDELDKVAALGITLVSEDEARQLQERIEHLVLRDFDFAQIANTFQRYGISLDDLSAIAVAVFDHGNAPPGVSDRQFRFDYLDQRIRACNSLVAESIPPIMTRLQAVARSAGQLPCPLIVMDTAPAAILGSTFDPVVAARPEVILCNIGNFHTLAFRLTPDGIAGLFEHHTGEINRPKLERLLRKLAEATLTHQDVFDDMGHGALMYTDRPFPFGGDAFDVVITGPRRSMFRTTGDGNLRPYFAAPFGDMMIAGCFGLLAAVAEHRPDLAEPIWASLRNQSHASAPWDI